MLKQRLKADVTEQKIPCGLSKGQGYLWKPEKMVTSLGNFKWNVHCCLLKGWLFLFSSWHKKNSWGFSGFAAMFPPWGGDGEPWGAAHTSGVGTMPWSCCWELCSAHNCWNYSSGHTPASPELPKLTQGSHTAPQG